MTQIFPPGPPNGLFGMRHTAALRDDLIGFCARLKREYGDVVHFRLGPHDCYQFTHPQQIHDVLVSKAASFRKPRRLKQVFGRFEGSGLVVSDGSLWARQRRLIQPAFAPSKLSDYSLVIRSCAEEMLERWKGKQVVDVYAEMRHLMLRIVARTLFSTDVDDVIDRVAAAVEVIQQWSMREMHRVVATPSWLPLWGESKTRRAIKFLRCQVQHIVHQRRNNQHHGEDLLARLIEAIDRECDGEKMSKRQLQDEMITLLLAGHETSAAAVTWAAWLLAKHPDVQDRVSQDIRAELRDHPLGFNDLGRLTAVEQVFKEAMRLYPPVYFLSRETTTAVEVAGYQLAPSSQVFLVPYLTHRDPRWFSDAERFNPQRFTNESEGSLPACSYFPFGAGPRACIGRGFAMMEGILVLAAVLRKFQLRLAKEQDEPSLAWQLSLHPGDKLYLAVEPR